jgi:hypothetical protein
MVEIKIRYASIDDYDLIKNFLDKNYPNDYIQSILKEWLLNKNGKIFLALSNNELVGLSHVYFKIIK